MYLYQYMNPEQIMLESMERLVSPGAKTFKDLCIKPISIAQNTDDLLRETFMWANHHFGLRNREYMV